MENSTENPKKKFKQKELPYDPKILFLRIYISESNTHTMKYHSTIKKNEILPCATIQMDHEGIKLSEISQTKTILYDLTYNENLKLKTKPPDSQRTNWWLLGRKEGWQNG